MRLTRANVGAAGLILAALALVTNSLVAAVVAAGLLYVASRGR